MKHLTLLLASLSLLVGCSNKQEINDKESTFHEPRYGEVENLHIHWNDLLNKEDDVYYVYVYSVYCTQCSRLREKIVNFAKSNIVKFYFIDPDDDIPFTEDESLIEKSLGANKIEDVYCYILPTLIGISKHEVNYYSKDYNEINDFIDSNSR